MIPYRNLNKRGANLHGQHGSRSYCMEFGYYMHVFLKFAFRIRPVLVHVALVVYSTTTITVRDYSIANL